MKKESNGVSTFLTVVLIIYTIFINKFVYLAPNLSVSIGLFIYPLTFLIPIIICNKQSPTDAKKAVLSSAFYLVIFYLIVTILSSVSGIVESTHITEALRTIFTPNSFMFGNTIIYYPHLFVFALLIVYIITRYILISVYEVLNHYTHTIFAFAVSLFIAFILDTILSVPLSNSAAIYFGDLGFIDVIKALTANFIIMVFTSLILIFIYPLSIKKKNKKRFKKLF